MGTDNRESDFKKKAKKKRHTTVFTGPQKESSKSGGRTSKGPQRPSMGDLDANRALLRHLDALAKGEIGRSSTGGGIGSTLREAFLDARNQLGALKDLDFGPQEEEFGGDLPGFTALAMPSRDSYLAPFLQAEQAANEAHAASTGVINQGAEQLVNRLNQGQEQFVADRDELGREEAMRRRLAQQELDQTLAPSGLAQELGVAPGIQAEGALIQGLANMANQSQDSLNENMAESQAQGFQSRLESADASKTNALATAANTLQTLLAQIGVGKAEAEQAFTQDSNRVRATNQQNEASARREFQKLQEEQRQAEEKLVQERQAIIDEYSMPAWEATRPLRAIRNENALAFFEGLIDNVAGKARSPQAKRAILEVLPEQIRIAREEGDGNFNEKVLRQWVEEYFSDKKILDEEALMKDPRVRGLG